MKILVTGIEQTGLYYLSLPHTSKTDFLLTTVQYGMPVTGATNHCSPIFQSVFVKYVAFDSKL